MLAFFQINIYANIFYKDNASIFQNGSRERSHFGYKLESICCISNVCFKIGDVKLFRNTYVVIWHLVHLHHCSPGVIKELQNVQSILILLTMFRNLYENVLRFLNAHMPKNTDNNNKSSFTGCGSIQFLQPKKKKVFQIFDNRFGPMEVGSGGPRISKTENQTTKYWPGGRFFWRRQTWGKNGQI